MLVVTIEQDLIPWVLALPSKELTKVVHVSVGSNIPSAKPSGETGGVFVVSVFGVTEANTEEIDAIASVARRVAKELGQVCVLVVGRGSFSAERRLRNQLRNTTVEVKCLGVLSPEGVARHLAQTDAFLFVRAAASTRRGSLIAALANALPVVAYEGPETGSVLRRAGILWCSEGDTRTAARHLCLIATDSELHALLSRRSYELYEAMFSWPSVADKFELILASVSGP
jgi:glycosyltransferase involved in cell wall biosynthesis